MLRKVNKDTRFISFSEHETAPLCDGVPVERIRRRGTFFRPVSSKEPTLEQALKRHNIDVLLTTIGASSISTRLPKLTFALDMILPGSLPVKNKVHSPVPRAIKRNCSESRFVLCASAYMQKVCSTRANVGLEKVVVARPGVSQSFTKKCSSIIEGPYAVFPMNRYSCRNIATVTEAIRRNPSLFPPTLVVMGPKYVEEPANWGIPKISVEQCPDNIISSLFQNAELILYPAQGDGSGTVAQQALCAGGCLITSKSGANFEAAGSIPFYFEADSSVSLLQIIRRMRGETPEEKTKRQQMGQALVLDCTWERCAAKIVSALKRSLL
ncbi:MAG: hypothetical protein KAH38_00175 [Candidatus Hydrogenedentes bacterium]|nr:hypothetical protein [Candidatus Hydrogenedentota bacterium]